MTRIYDNWEKLVGAVLRREKDRQLAFCPSLSSADVSSRPSFSSDVSTNPDQMLMPAYYSGERSSFPPNVTALEIEEIKKATQNFLPRGILGEEGCGRVFKGWVNEHNLTATKPGSGIPVAVKKMYIDGFQSRNEWLAEINYLSQLHHPNLVKLIGYSSDKNNMILVHEFIPRGSLDSHLFTRRNQPLPWATRIKVAIGASRALAFLHNLEISVIHGNIKSRNILLDADFNPKLSDFGLAIDGPTSGMTHVETRFMGASGYAAPEYVATGHFTSRCDVYGFGVVLLELITGLRALDIKRPVGQQRLIDWVKPNLRNKKKLLRLMDSRLDGQYPRKEAYEVARIGLQCANSDPKLRPRMNEVVAALEKL